jgi:hypothetical protein
VAHHLSAGVVVLVAMYLLPAIITLFFAWATWADRKYVISDRRRRAFISGLFSTSVAIFLLLPACSHLIETGGTGNGWFVVSARLGALCWAVGLTAALAGKGAARILLFSSGLLLFLGVFGIAVATTP